MLDGHAQINEIKLGSTNRDRRLSNIFRAAIRRLQRSKMAPRIGFEGDRDNKRCGAKKCIK